MKEVAQLQTSNINMQEKIAQLKVELSQERTANATLRKEAAATKVDLQDKQAAIVSLQGSTKNHSELQAQNEKLAGELQDTSQQLASAHSAMAISGEQMKVRNAFMPSFPPLLLHALPSLAPCQRSRPMRPPLKRC